MNVAVLLTFQAIENLLNETFGEVLHEGRTHNPGGVITYVRVFKKDLIKIYRQDEEIVSIVPVRVRVSMRKNDPFLISLIKDLSNVEKTSFDILVEFRTNVSVEDGGKINSSTTGTFSWVTKPKMGIGLLKVKITELVKPALEKELSALTQDIDDSIVEAVNIKAYAKLALNELNKPQEIVSDRGNQTQISDWFVAKPLSEPLITGNIRLRDKGVVLPVTLGVDPEIYLGLEKPAVGAINMKLPSIVLKKDLASQFSLNLTTKIGYQVLINEIKNQPFALSAGAGKLIIEDISFHPEDENIKVLSDFNLFFKRSFIKLGIKGRAEIISRLKVDSSEKIILEDFKLRLKNLPFWARTIYRISRKGFRRQISKTVEAAIEDQLMKIKEEVSTLLASYDLDNGLALSVTLDHFSPVNLRPDTSFLSVDLEVEGQMDLVINAIEREPASTVA